MIRKPIAAFAALMLATLAFVVTVAPTGAAYGAGCQGTKTTTGNVTKKQEQCSVVVGEDGYIVCVGYTMTSVSGGDTDPSRTTQCSTGIRPGSDAAPPTVESPLLP